jgi:hypothetical protein
MLFDDLREGQTVSFTVGKAPKAPRRKRHGALIRFGPDGRWGPP